MPNETIDPRELAGKTVRVRDGRFSITGKLWLNTEDGETNFAVTVDSGSPIFSLAEVTFSDDEISEVVQVAWRIIGIDSPEYIIRLK